jgi:hypothetical protein
MRPRLITSNTSVMAGLVPAIHVLPSLAFEPREALYDAAPPAAAARRGRAGTTQGFSRVGTP